MNSTNISIEDFFKRVRASVLSLSNGRQTSWEHTTLTNNFNFNLEKFVHAVDLPYKLECIADKNFKSSGTDIDNIIEGLKSHNFYKQRDSINALNNIMPNDIDKDSLFLLGRNLLQTAEGEERTARSIFWNLENWLSKYFTDKDNHVLNGILFEIYFNSKGKFREKGFKSSFIDNIFKLQMNEKYNPSFDFIINQLTLFKDSLYYIPSNPPNIVTLEFQFERFEYNLKERTINFYKVKSIKKGDFELLSDNEAEINSSIKIESFIVEVRQILKIPKNMLQIISNIEIEDIKEIENSYRFKDDLY